MPGLIATETLPGETAPLAASTIQPLQEQGVHHSFKAVQRMTVIGELKVVEMSSQLLPDDLPELRPLTRVAFLAEPLIDGCQSTAKSFL